MQESYLKHVRNTEKNRDLIFAASSYLWKHPETGYKEWESQKYLAGEFEKLGYTLTYAGDIPGFYTDLDTGRPGPTILIMGELDALCVESHPDADPVTHAVHACGHCAQGAGILGAAAALKEPGALDDLCGKIRIMAVPAEEAIEIEYREKLREQGIIKFFGGKQEFVARGYMDGVDIDILIHTSSGRQPGMATVDKGANGFIIKNFTFLGKSAHAAGPSKGINALYAANQALSGINALRETFQEKDHIRVHPIITCGGTVVNAIPERVTVESYVRGASVEAILRENEKVNRAAASAALCMGANLQIADRPGYLPQNYGDDLRKISFEAIELALGEGKAAYSDGWGGGSSDMGDLTVLYPTAYLHVTGATGHGHGNDYRVDDAESLCVNAAKILTVFVQLLLENGAERAKKIIADFKPLYKNKEEYCAAMDAMTLDCTAVTYNEDGTATVRYK